MSYYNNLGKKWWGLELNSNGHGVLRSAVTYMKNEKNHSDWQVRDREANTIKDDFQVCGVGSWLK